MLTKGQWIQTFTLGYEALSSADKIIADETINNAYAQYVAENS